MLEFAMVEGIWLMFS